MDIKASIEKEKDSQEKVNNKLFRIEICKNFKKKLVKGLKETVEN